MVNRQYGVADSDQQDAWRWEAQNPLTMDGFSPVTFRGLGRG